MQQLISLTDTIKDKLMQLIEKSGLSQIEISERIGVTANYFSQLKNKKEVGIQTALLIEFVHKEIFLSTDNIISLTDRKSVEALSKLTGNPEKQIVSLAIKHFLESIQKSVVPSSEQALSDAIASSSEAEKLADQELQRTRGVAAPIVHKPPPAHGGGRANKDKPSPLKKARG